MNNLSKNYVNDEGNEETIVASSSDNYTVKLDNYTLSNQKIRKESKLAKKFKGSFLGADIGIKSGGFSTIAILATVIALAVLVADNILCSKSFFGVFYKSKFNTSLSDCRRVIGDNSQRIFCVHRYNYQSK